ncbi:MAG: hypothetical protein JSS89_13115 [Bacteroidetes bacterium]|nr:hypothetical protein [Bacteroidota bacterium]
MENASENLLVDGIDIPVGVVPKPSPRTELLGIRITKAQKGTLKKAARIKKCEVTDLVNPAVFAVIAHYERMIEAQEAQ